MMENVNKMIKMQNKLFWKLQRIVVYFTETAKSPTFEVIYKNKTYPFIPF